MWLLFAFLSPAFYAIAEISDNFLINKKFRHTLTLVFYSSLFNLIFIPILFIFQPPTLPPLNTIPIFIMLGLVGIGYLYPYYKGLSMDETSVVVSFFAIGRIFVPILAFIIIGERLDIQQYIGIILIIISVVILAIHHSHKHFKFSKALWYISFAAILIAFEGVFLKLLFENGVSVSTAIVGESIICLIFGLCILFFKSPRKDIKSSLPLFIRLSPIFLMEELFTFLGYLTESYAISLTSVSVVKGITMASPFFLLIYAWIGHGMFPSLFKENLHTKNIIKKLLLFIILILGIIFLKD